MGSGVLAASEHTGTHAVSQQLGGSTRCSRANHTEGFNDDREGHGSFHISDDKRREADG